MVDAAMWMAAMIVLTTLGVVILTLVRGRQRLAEIRAANGPRLEAERDLQLLNDENSGLKKHIGRLEARLATVEQIVTDPAERTAREIDQLR